MNNLPLTHIKAHIGIGVQRKLYEILHFAFLLFTYLKHSYLNRKCCILCPKSLNCINNFKINYGLG